VRNDELIAPWFERLREELPEVELFDAHTHTGHNDPDGFHATAGEVIEGLERAGARGVVFSLQEPEGYAAANDRVLAEAEDSGGRLVAFCRVSPHDDPAAEAVRCLDRGARGVKLHPRAERFTLDHTGARAIFALADERRIPVMVHAGRGIPALGRHALELASEFPGARIILAHAGISDLAWIWREAPDHPNLFFDTSWWSATDLLALFARVPPGQILWASDTPYGTPTLTAVLALRCAVQAGLGGEALRCVCGGQVERLLAGEEPFDAGAPPGDAGLRADALLDRVATFLVSALARALDGGDPAEMLALARLACDVPPDVPQAPVCRSVRALLELMDRAVVPDTRQPRGIDLVAVAQVVARTPDVGVPAVEEPARASPSDTGGA
jgi:predicted TIM-barrel fold metal-dependent hydrolase